MEAEQQPRGGRSLALLVALAAAAGAVACAAIVMARAGDEVYAIPDWGVAATIVLAAVVLSGALALIRSRQGLLGFAVMLGTLLLVFGVLAMFSIGLLALIAAAPLLAWAGAARWPGGRRGLAMAGASLAGAALPILVVFALAGPLVECDAEGSSGGENIFLGLTSSEASGSVMSTPDGVQTGRQSGEDYVYTYTCRGDRLVAFDLQRR